MQKKTIAVIGANGQLGSEISYLSDKYKNYNFHYVDFPEIDITKDALVRTYFESVKPDFVINCAAYTAVDKAESEQENAFKVNVTGAELLAKFSNEYDSKLIHVSTDFVFDGKGFLPYTEEDKPNPLSVYGDTKLKGEEAVLSNSKDALVIRTSWLYSKHGGNFVKTMLRLGAERDELNVIFDQVGTPTWARDLAKAILDVIQFDNMPETENRLYHYSNEGVASWYDFALEIMDIKNLNCMVFPILTEQYPTPAKRPHYSVLNKNKIKKDFNFVIPHWKESLINCLKDL